MGSETAKVLKLNSLMPVPWSICLAGVAAVPLRRELQQVGKCFSREMLHQEISAFTPLLLWQQQNNKPKAFPSSVSPLFCYFLPLFPSCIKPRPLRSLQLALEERKFFCYTSDLQKINSIWTPVHTFAEISRHSLKSSSVVAVLRKKTNIFTHLGFNSSPS